MSDSDILESSCHVWDVDFQIPDDDSIPCRIFKIEIHANLTKASYEDEDEDIEFSFLEPETVFMQRTEELKLELLVNDSVSAAEAVSNMLVSMEYVPVRDFIVVKILDCAHRMVATRKYRNRKVLRIHVEIDAIVDQLPDDYDDDEDDGTDEEPVLETAAIVEKLSEVVVESPNSCSICLDEFLVGRQATSLPCRHFFHRHCIMSWLNKKNHCPLCRRNLSG